MPKLKREKALIKIVKRYLLRLLLGQAIACHPLAVREMAKQSKDLRFLKQAEKLNPDFVEWLRTSFDNDGKSLIDLG